jgi:hypothetical protein
MLSRLTASNAPGSKACHLPLLTCSPRPLGVEVAFGPQLAAIREKTQSEPSRAPPSEPGNQSDKTHVGGRVASRSRSGRSTWPPQPPPAPPPARVRLVRVLRARPRSQTPSRQTGSCSPEARGRGRGRAKPSPAETSPAQRARQPTSQMQCQQASPTRQGQGVGRGPEKKSRAGRESARGVPDPLFHSVTRVTLA